MKGLFLAIVAAGLLALTSQTAAARAALVQYAPGWQLVAGPEGSTLTGASGSLYTLQPGDTSYEVLPPTTPLHAGWGYWAYFPAVGSLNAGQAGGAVTRTLSPGQWVMIGDPLADLTGVVSGADTVLTYTGSQYEAHTELPAGSGAWAMATGSISINRRPPRAASCSQSEAAQAYDAVNPLVLAFADGYTVARSTPRIALAPQITALQGIHRQLTALTLPSCALGAQTWYDLYMGESIQAMVLFLGQSADSVVQYAIDSANTNLPAAERELAALKAIAGR